MRDCPFADRAFPTDSELITVHRLPLASLACALATAALTCTLLAPAATAAPATATSDPGPVTPQTSATPLATSQDALARAATALGRDTPPQVGDRTAPRRTTQEAAGRPDATLALRDLFLARPTLDGDDSELAGHLLARPTDGAGDPYDDGYTTTSTKTCGADVCVHWVRTGPDAPANAAWARKTLQVMEQVWRHHVDALGYRAPATDGTRGGNAKFDVYLKELGSEGVYGYCAPETRVSGQARQASGFCVLDNDFARRQFGRAPLGALRVTAAHEFFHAIQFAYDFREDPWLLESTATWMEEQFADGVNDNRSYLRYGQVGKPATSLDVFQPNGFAHYGNWTFWEYLTERYGPGIVRRVIRRTGTGGGLPDDYSIQAVKHVLAAKGGLPKVFAAYAAGNTRPATTYDEGRTYPVAAPAGGATLRTGAVRAVFHKRVDHLASKTLRLRPGPSLSAKRWRLRLAVDGPAASTSPAAHLIVTRTNGTSFQRRLRLDRAGRGSTSVVFSSRSIATVTVTLANVSTRYTCVQKTSYSCAGTPRDQARVFQLTARAYRG